MLVEKYDKEPPFKLHELRCFEAVVRLGSFQAAANTLNRTHPSVFAAVGRLEKRLDLLLLDRAGYRVRATEAGQMFLVRARALLRETIDLGSFAQRLSEGEEPVLRVVLGDLCPRELVLPYLSRFFAERKRTRLHLDYEAVGGPMERLRNDTADIIFHRADDSSAGIEQVHLFALRLVPVISPGLLPNANNSSVTPDELRSLTQCVIRDTARQTPSEQHFLIDGAHQCSVADHIMKKEMILNHMGWGHLPDFMIGKDLQSGALVSLQSRHLPGRAEILAAIRRDDKLHGPVATELWDFLSSASIAPIE